jgi:hypothetical protein
MMTLRRATHIPSRGFLPWRFADAGPCARLNRHGAGHPKTFTNADIARSHPITSSASTRRLCKMVRPSAGRPA